MICESNDPKAIMTSVILVERSHEGGICSY